MPATQQVDKVSFGTGRAFYLPAGATQYSKYGNVKELSLDIKIELKEIYDENGFPLAVFDGHKSIDLSLKHYALRLDGLVNDLAQGAAGASTSAFSLDEAIVVPTTPFTVTLAQAAQMIAGTAVVTMYVGANKNPVQYSIVNSGSEVAGVSCSIAAGVLKFAAADTGLTGKVDYQYTDALGTSMSLNNTYQNSIPSYQFVFLKRDKSPLDSSVGQLLVTLFAVRFGGIKTAYTEGAEVVYERTLKAFANPQGQIGTVQFVNTTTNNAP